MMMIFTFISVICILFVCVVIIAMIHDWFIDKDFFRKYQVKDLEYQIADYKRSLNNIIEDRNTLNLELYNYKEAIRLLGKEIEIGRIQENLQSVEEGFSRDDDSDGLDTKLDAHVVPISPSSDGKD